MNAPPVNAPPSGDAFSPPPLERCPHCGGTTTTEPSVALRAVCGACGGARVPGLAALGVTLSREAIQALARAKSERTKERSAKVVAFSLVFMALVVSAIAGVAAATGHGGPAFGAAALAAIDFALAVFAWTFARGPRSASRDALDSAWASVAVQIAQKRGGQITARELAEALRTPEADADAILAKVSLGGARVEVDDEAQLHYRVDVGDARSGGAAREPAKREASR